VANPFEDETGEFLVLVNHEGQYCLWPGFRDVPQGWTQAGSAGDRAHCLDWIEQHWTDMSPRSLRSTQTSCMESKPRKNVLF
jgi:MbtH protein